jgi:tetratricopeptide (TPR) repeat protein
VPISFPERKPAEAGVEMPTPLPSSVNSLDECIRHLLFADKYISASDYSSAEEEMEEADKICNPNNPDYNYMKAVLFEAEEKEKEAYSYYYRAAKLYLGKKMMNQVFKCYSGMLSINPDGEEVKELRPYFQDDDY